MTTATAERTRSRSGARTTRGAVPGAPSQHELPLQRRAVTLPVERKRKRKKLLRVNLHTYLWDAIRTMADLENRTYTGQTEVLLLDSPRFQTFLAAHPEFTDGEPTPPVTRRRRRATVSAE